VVRIAGVLSLSGVIACVGCNGLMPVNMKSNAHFTYSFSYADSSWKKDTVILPISLDSSKDVWNRIKRDNGSTYLYTYHFGSVFGHGGSDLVLVKNDTVDEVIITSTHVNQNNGDNIIDTQYLITKANKEITRFKTVDEFYAFAEDTVMTKDTAQNWIGVFIDAKGVLVDAYYAPKMCFDDCHRDYNIGSLSFINIQH